MVAAMVRDTDVGVLLQVIHLKVLLRCLSHIKPALPMSFNMKHTGFWRKFLP